MRWLRMLRRLLVPLIPVYRFALFLREMRLLLGLESVKRLRFPVISIGNLSTGGSGKTPLAIALAKALTERGQRVDVLSRGYGRRSKHTVRVDAAGCATEFGDEPLLITREATVPVYVASQRYDAGLLAESEALPSIPASEIDGKPNGSPALIHLLDDGFQHRQLARNVNILLLDKLDWQDQLLPVGNLREPLKVIPRATVVAVPENKPNLEKALRAWGWQGPIWRLRRKMEVKFFDQRVAAFCGIARPDPFFQGLEEAGLSLALRFAFPDHSPYTEKMLDRILAEAHRKQVVAIITTAKDLVRLGDLADQFPGSMPLVVARLSTEILEQDAVLDWLEEQLAVRSRYMK